MRAIVAATASRAGRYQRHHALCSAPTQLLIPNEVLTSQPTDFKSTRSFVSLADIIPMATKSAPREHRPSPPPLPAPQLFHLPQENVSIEYIDIQSSLSGTNASTTTSATMVLVHGSPGTYQDFRHIIPLLQQQHQQQSVDLRIIAMNLPGFGDSTVDKEQYFEQISALNAAKLTLQMLLELCAPEENVFLMGHSFGAHAAINIAALNQELREGRTTTPDKPALNVKGMALLAPAGCRPHHVLRPKQNAVVIDMLRSSNPIISKIMPPAIKLLYTKLLGFSSDYPASHFVAGIVRAGTTDFAVVSDHVRAIKDTVPALLAWSKSDEYMEEAIPQELAARCHPLGPRIAFTGGGHNIQKTRADILALEVTQWVRDVLLHCGNSASVTGNKVGVEEREVIQAHQSL